MERISGGGVKMLDNAVKKLTDEMEKAQGNAYIQHVGAFLIGHINFHPDQAEKILAEGKTIQGSLAAMRDEAKKKQTGGCSVLTDQEGFEIVLKYYGIDRSAPASETAQAPPEKKQRFNISLDDLL
jgi:hypothetical protein